MTSTINRQPPTQIDPVTDILHGVAITDPYRWLEEDSLQTRKWLKEQEAYTRTYLGSMPGRDCIRKRVEELMAIEIVSEPWKMGHRYFYLKRGSHQEQAVITVRDDDSGEEIVIVDPATRGEGSAVSVNIANISPEGSILAFGVRHDGADFQSIEFLDIEKRQILPDRLPNGLGYGLVFLPEGKRFCYSREVCDSPRPHHRAVCLHDFSCESAEDVEVFLAGEDPNLHVSICGSSDGQILSYLISHSGDPITFDLYLHDVASGTSPKQIVERAQSLLCPFFVGHTLLAMTDHEARNCRIVSIDPLHPEPDRWCDVVPESQSRIEGFAVVEDWICVSYLENHSSRIQALRPMDGKRRTIPCPPRGTAQLLRRPIKSNTLFYEFCTFDQPPAIFSYQPTTGEHKVFAKAQVAFDPSSIELKQVNYRSKDGTNVPMYLVSNRQLTGPAPTLLTGYGGFGYNHTPQFKVSTSVLLERGFLFAIANVRGGGELGEQWHCAGKRHKRQNAVDDFVAAAEWLLENGYTAPGKLAISGGSNAGLLMGAALTQRPDLFRVVVCSGPLLDMLRYHRFDNADRWIEEYGVSENREDFPYLLNYSPYHRVESGIPYPSVMLVSGDADSRCNPMHVRKMAAKLQAATSSFEHPILLNYKPTWGHIPSQPLKLRIDAVVDRLAFICHELASVL
jgi:prolyl oligopeptidase